MKKPLTLNPLNQAKFSMIELVLCLAVVVVGVIGVLGLFPVGLDTNKKTMGISFATDAGEQFLRFNASKIKNDWTWTNVFANSKPGSDESHLSWNDSAIFNAGNVYIKSTNDLDPEVDNNSGFFCLQQMTGENVDFTAVLRVWKNVEASDTDDSQRITLNVEVSWPVSVPYDSSARNKQQFDLEVFKAPEVAVDTANYGTCSLTREHGAGFSTTLGAIANEDGSYSSQLMVVYDGCTDAECLQLVDYVVETDSDYSIDYLTGEGTDTAITAEAVSSSDLFDGFKVSFADGMGEDGASAWFKLDYTFSTLNDQQMAVRTASADHVVNFTKEDFDYVLTCTTEVASEEEEGEGDAGSGNSGDDTYSTSVNTTLLVDTTLDGFSLNSNNSNNKGVLKNDDSPNGPLTAFLISSVKNGTLSLNADGSFMYEPNVDWVGTDKFIYKGFDGIKMTKPAKVSIEVTPSADPCDGNSSPSFADFTLADTEVGASYSATITAENLPTDIDGDTVTLSASGMPSWLTFNANSKTFSGTPTSEGSFSTNLIATDECGLTGTATVSITVNAGCGTNQGPEWSTSAISITAVLDQNISELISEATDPEGSNLSYSLEGGPSWLSISGGQISGIPTAEGTFTATLTAKDSCDVSASTSLKIFVVNPCNLMVNGSFETHGALSNGSWGVLQSWDGWFTTYGAGIEIQRNVAGAAYDGSVKVELDSHDLVQDGQNVPSNSRMAQDLRTSPGVEYTLEFYYSPRSCGNSNLCDASSNTVEVWWDGVLLESMSRSGLNNGGQTDWTKHTHTITGGSEETTRLEFRAAGRENTYGGYIDLVSVTCAGSSDGGSNPPTSTPSVEFQTAASSGSEAIVNVPLNVVLSSTSTDTVTVSYAVTGASTAISGSDYNLPSGVLTFSPGETTKTIPMNVLNDSVQESDETVVVVLSSPSNATLGTVSQHVYTINDDDFGSTVSGAQLNINPANSSGNIFKLTKADGSELDMNDMSDYYHNNGKTNMSYSGGATKVKIKVKSTGRTITINGQDVELNTNTRYTFSGDMTVDLNNTRNNPSSWGQAKGHWWISIAGTDIEITPAP